MRYVPLVIAAQDSQGNVLPGAVLTALTRPGGVAVQLWNGAALVNNAVADARGMISGVYINQGDYTLNIAHPTLAGGISYPFTAASSTVPVLTALPAAVDSADGDEIFFQSAAMANDGALWRLRYRAASASAYKWEVVSATELVGVGAYSQWNGNAPSDGSGQTLGVVLPLAGDYDVTLQTQLSADTGGGVAYASFSFGPLPATIADGIQSDNNINGVLGRRASARTVRKLGLPATTLYFKIWTNGTGFAVADYRTLRVRPVRVG